jgi:hypothetical protein
LNSLKFIFELEKPVISMPKELGCIQKPIALQPGKKPFVPVPEVLFIDVPKELIKVEEEGQVILHCSFLAFPGALIRIWPSTFLVTRESKEKIPMIHAENITYAPVWTQLDGYGVFTFTLIFKRLPKSCSFFDMVEEISEAGSFHIPDIERNNSDIYQVWI